MEERGLTESLLCTHMQVCTQLVQLSNKASSISTICHCPEGLNKQALHVQNTAAGYKNLQPAPEYREKNQKSPKQRNWEVKFLLTLFFSEKVPGIPANRNLFFTFSFPRLATIRLLDFELSGMSSTGAPASISRRTREARWALSLT